MKFNLARKNPLRFAGSSINNTKILPVEEEAKSVLWGTILNAEESEDSPFDPAEQDTGGDVVPLSEKKTLKD